MNPVFSTAIGFGALSAGLLGWSLFELVYPIVQEALLPSPFLKPLRSPTTLQKKAALGLAGCLAVTLWAGFAAGLSTFFVLGLGAFAVKNFPDWIKNREKELRQRKMRDLFPQTLGIALQALRSGQTIPQVVDYLSRESPEPLRGEWTLVCGEMALGSSAEQALAKMGESYPRFQEFHQFLESYKISRSTGANLTQLVQVLLEDMEEKSRIRRKMEAMTAQARLSGWMVGLLPFLLGFVFFLMDPGLITPLFTESAGLAILLLAALLELIGFLWVRQLMRLEF